ncbi:unnamed protein product [Ostreobium quekettii]|uniref:Double-strand break repair protein n=1 Tax=Ostreobium quekettii TaxID=121088 RepID=A0A8S1IUH7_9CHLO|nr:unnamed protein product [Ostreobium quekettii]|eukprot:evm.model.scf_76.7 EVM.evm.TU.scf_76.7   scf_76:47077-56917(+)
MAADEQRRNTLKILIATDNHLGVWERDNVRRDDSFDAFEEVFEMAQRLEVDCVLLGGDLFHENKPSRSTLIRAMGTLTRHCLSDKPVNFQVLSDQSAFERKCVNFEDPNLNIGMPVFTIHGNHDDPSGDGNLSSVDVLSSCGLVNYFGKMTLGGSQGPGKIRLAPVLLQKGSTKVALYGLGHIRDERLGRLFQTPGCVEWIRPKESPGYPTDDWFNIFVLHQNRVQHGQHAKNCIQEKCLASFLDLVIWGHEHECIPEPQESAVGNFSILQPGSSVATALSEGESKPKHVFVLDILGDKWRTMRHEIKSVRPYEFAQVTLADQMEVDCQNQDSIKKFLERRVEQMLEKALKDKPPAKPGQKPLIRLRVDYTGCSTISSQIFGQMFVGKVANPHDLLLWTRASKRNRDAVVEDNALGSYVRPEEHDQDRIDELIVATLQHDLEILPEDELANALRNFVDKDEKGALAAMYNASLAETQKAAIASDAARAIEDEQHVGDVISKQVKQRQSKKEVAAALGRARAPGPTAPVHGEENAHKGRPADDDVELPASARPPSSNTPNDVINAESSADVRPPTVDEGLDSPRTRGAQRKRTRLSSATKARAATATPAVNAAERPGAFVSSDDEEDVRRARAPPSRRGRRRQA